MSQRKPELARMPSRQPSRTGRPSTGLRSAIPHTKIPLTGRATTDLAGLQRMRTSSEPGRPKTAAPFSVSASRGRVRALPPPRPNLSDPRELKKKEWKLNIAELEKVCEERSRLVSELTTQNCSLTLEMDNMKTQLNAKTMLHESACQEVARLTADGERMKREAEERESSLKAQLVTQDQKVRTLLNDVVDLRGKIRVAVRLRPFVKGEDAGESLSHIGFPDRRSISVNNGSKPTAYQFQHVFCQASQEYVFDEFKELIESVISGYNVAIIAYGQTGSGKTYTMRGGEGDQRGLIPRAVEFMFLTRNNLKSMDWTYEYAASFLEVYNDDVFDLLRNERTKLKVVLGTGRVDIPDLKTVALQSPDDLHELMLLADKNRSTAATKMNETSSRSHAVFTLRVTATNAISSEAFTSSLSLVDLAGSERAKESEVSGPRFTEMTHINKALSNLQNVIRCQLRKEAHVPYRNSKLTMLLQECLGKGNSKTLMLVNLRPSFANLTETKRSLDFAANVVVREMKPIWPLCGPFLSKLCMVVSVIGVVFLALLGAFFYVGAVSLFPELHFEEEPMSKAEIDRIYATKAYQCWSAAGLYLLTLIFAMWQNRLNEIEVF